MKILTIILTVLTVNCFAQTVNRVFEKNKNIFATYSDGNTKQITSLSQDHNPSTPKDNSFVVFVRTPGGTLTEDESLSGKRIETKIVKIDLKTLKEIVLVQGCRNEKEMADISYANSDIYPFGYLCSIENAFVTPEGNRVYFSTEAWNVSGAIHYYSLENGKIFFFSSGDFQGLDYVGNVQVTLTSTNVDKGRYFQEWLLDANGKKIKPLSEERY